MSTPRSLENALNWLEQHKEDEDLNDELFIIKGQEKKQRTPEELREAAKEMQMKLRLNREAKEKELNDEQEKNRRLRDKELALASKLSKEAR